eukprot:scaffold146_cov374-Prasinococcus_capsulatus_cf.AAC.8
MRSFGVCRRGLTRFCGATRPSVAALVDVQASKEMVTHTTWLATRKSSGRRIWAARDVCSGGSSVFMYIVLAQYSVPSWYCRM